MVITQEPAGRRRPTGRTLVTATVWLLTVPFLLWALMRGLGLERGSPTVQLIAFTPYVAAASLVPMVVAIATKRLWPAVLAMVAALVLAACVLPRWITDGHAGPPLGVALRVLSVNLLLGQADVDKVAELVREQRVDLLAVQEFTEEGGTALQRAGLHSMLPNVVAYPLAGVGGSAIYSRLPLADEGFRLHGSGFGQAKAKVSVGVKAVHVESVHPCAPAARSRDTCWRADLANQPAASSDGPLRLLVGDFNATLDHAALRDLIDKGYRDAADAVGAGLVASWPYDERWYIPGVTIDHVLADRRMGVRTVSMHRIPRSDHRAIFAELVVPDPTAS